MGQDGNPAGLNQLAAQATTHCLTGCAIGEVLGLVIATQAMVLHRLASAVAG